MTYVLGARSLGELHGVHPRLVGVVKRALQLTRQDFAVHDGLRTEAEQRENIARGVSWTMNSKHLKQPDGWGHAVDLVPYVNGKLRWEWPAIYPIASAVHQAADELGVALRWGGSWRPLLETAGSPEVLERAVMAYGQRQRQTGKRSSPDGPHFELIL